jgi:hypothetical protein
MRTQQIRKLSTVQMQQSLKKNIQKYIFKTRCKWENKIRGAQPPLEVTKEQKHEVENGLREKIREIQLVHLWWY